MNGRAALRAFVPPIAALILIATIWEAAVRALSVPAYLLPPPSAVARAGAASIGDLAKAAAITGESALAGFALSAIFGALGGVVLSRSRLLENALYPYALFLQTVPIVAIAPLLVLWFGAGPRAVAMSAFIVSVFPVLANTLAGFRAVDPGLRDLFRLYGASRGATLLELELPSALPHLVTGLRVASGLAVIGAIVGEFVAGFAEGDAGLGIVVLAAYRQLHTDLLFAAVLAASALGLALFGAVSAAGHVALLRRGGSQ